MPASTASRGTAIPALRPIRPTRRRRRVAEKSWRSAGGFARQQGFRESFGAAFVDYFAHIKEAEFARFEVEGADQADVTAWEQNEYFDLF